MILAFLPDLKATYDMSEDSLASKLKSMLSSMLKFNAGRKKWASVIEESRTTTIINEEDKRMLEEVLPDNQFPEVPFFTLGIEVKLRVSEGDEASQEMLSQLKRDLKKLMKGADKVIASLSEPKVQQLSDLVFRTFNIEHKGHDIKQGS